MLSGEFTKANSETPAGEPLTVEQMRAEQLQKLNSEMRFVDWQIDFHDGKKWDFRGSELEAKLIGKRLELIRRSQPDDTYGTLGARLDHQQAEAQKDIRSRQSTAVTL